MQCPNCKLNIKDDATFCIHCGCRFQTNSSTPNVNNLSQSTNTTNVMNNQSQNPQLGIPVANQNNSNGVDKDKYLKAYFGTRYVGLLNEKFSIGTFFLGVLWLIFHKLYGKAVEYFFATTGVAFLLLVANKFILTPIINLIAKANSTLALVLLFALLIFEIVIFVRLVVYYAKNHSAFCFDKADRDIDTIIRTTDNEEERLNLCKQYGKPNYVAFGILVFIIFISPIINVLILVGYFSINNSRIDSFNETASQYLDAAKETSLVDKVYCKRRSTDTTFDINIRNQEVGRYYYIPISSGSNYRSKLTNADITSNPINNSNNLMKKKVSSPWKKGNLYGYICIDTSLSNYSIALIDDGGHGIVGYNSNSFIFHRPLKADELSRNNFTLSNANFDMIDLDSYNECEVRN